MSSIQQQSQSHPQPHQHSFISKGQHEDIGCPLQPPGDQATTSQACAAATQVSQGAKADKIGALLKASVVPLNIKATRTTDPMVIIRAMGGQQSSSNLLLRAAAYDAVCQ